jgi:hypothetical protein
MKKDFKKVIIKKEKDLKKLTGGQSGGGKPIR